MPCFMPENLHTQDIAGAAAQDCVEKQRSFRYAPFSYAGCVLIQTHKNKTKNIYKK